MTAHDLALQQPLDMRMLEAQAKSDCFTALPKLEKALPKIAWAASLKLSAIMLASQISS